jgi:energy-coupling factor transporter transmembrane protein EcfT
LSSAIARKFLDSASDILEVIDLRGSARASPVFTVMSFIIIVLTSFTSSICVVMLTLATSIAVLASAGNTRNHLRKLTSALIYVFIFSLVALTPFLIDGHVSLYFFYVLRAVGATSFLLVMTVVTGWEGLGEFMRRLKLPDATLILTTYVKMIAVLLRDTSKILLSREARLFRKAGLKDLPTYATVVGDLIIRSCERGRRTILAMEARSLSALPEGLGSLKPFKPSRLDILVSFIASAELLIQVVGGASW